MHGPTPAPLLSPAVLPPGLDDPYQHGRGVALADFNRDGKVDVVYGNWNGPHRLYLQTSASGRPRFRVRAGPGARPVQGKGPGSLQLRPPTPSCWCPPRGALVLPVRAGASVPEAREDELCRSWDHHSLLAPAPSTRGA